MTVEHEKREIAPEALDDAVRDGFITRRQADAIREVRARVFENDSLGYPDNYEYKEFKVEVSRVVTRRDDGTSSPGRWTLFVSTCVGRKRDEGTMAEVFARERRLIMVGPRGSLRNLLAKTKRRSHGWWAVRGSTGR